MAGNISPISEPDFRRMIKKIDLMLWQRAWLCRGVLISARNSELRTLARQSLQHGLRHRAMAQTLTPIGKRLIWQPISPTMFIRGIQLGLCQSSDMLQECLSGWRNTIMKRYRDTIAPLTKDPSRTGAVATLKRMQSES